MTRAVIVKAKRTVIGKKGGILKEYPPEQLAAAVIRDLVQDLPKQVDDIILGNVVGPGGNMARLSSLESDLPFSVPGVTIDRQCGSGLEAIRLACHLIQGGAGIFILQVGLKVQVNPPMKKERVFHLSDLVTRKWGWRQNMWLKNMGFHGKCRMSMHCLVINELLIH